MNWIDLLLLFFILMAMWMGWRKGFLLGGMDLAALAGSVALAFGLYPYLALFMKNSLGMTGVWNIPFAFIIILLLSRFLLGFAGNRLINAFPPNTHENVLNRLLGVIPGFINGLLYAMIVTALLIGTPFSDIVSRQVRDSPIAAELEWPAQWMENKLSPVFDEAINNSLSRLRVDPAKEGPVTLPFTVNETETRPDLESRMLILLNEERTKAGLPLLEADPELRGVARSHARDMFARSYFSHVTPEGKDPFDRMKQAGIKYRAAGENLALAPTLMIAHTGLMKSPGHRANILRPAFQRVGIGIIDGGRYGLMVVQEFRNKAAISY